MYLTHLHFQLEFIILKLNFIELPSIFLNYFHFIQFLFIMFNYFK